MMLGQSPAQRCAPAAPAPAPCAVSAPVSRAQRRKKGNKDVDGMRKQTEDDAEDESKQGFPLDVPSPEKLKQVIHADGYHSKLAIATGTWMARCLPTYLKWPTEAQMICKIIELIAKPADPPEYLAQGGIPTGLGLGALPPTADPHGSCPWLLPLGP